MKIILIIIVFIAVGCTIQQKETEVFSKADSTSFENRALLFFRDSLLHKKGLFGVETDGVYRDIPFMDSSMYVNGFFSSNRLFYSLLSISLSNPPIDSSDVSFLSSSEANTLEELCRNFRNKSLSVDTVHLLSINNFTRLDWYQYVANIKEYTQGVYLIVHRYLSGGERNFVQLEFREVDQHDLYFSHNLYIELNAEGKIIDWWLKY